VTTLKDRYYMTLLAPWFSKRNTFVLREVMPPPRTTNIHQEIAWLKKRARRFKITSTLAINPLFFLIID